MSEPIVLYDPWISQGLCGISLSESCAHCGSSDVRPLSQIDIGQGLRRAPFKCQRCDGTTVFVYLQNGYYADEHRR